MKKSWKDPWTVEVYFFKVHNCGEAFGDLSETIGLVMTFIFLSGNFKWRHAFYWDFLLILCYTTKSVTKS